MQDNQIFRKQALKRISSPDQLDRLVEITSPLGWAALLALAIVVIATLVWSVAGRLPITATGEGVLLPNPGLASVATLEAGQVTDLAVSENQNVTAGETVATVRTATGTRSVTATIDGRVAEVLVAQWSPVDAGSVLMRIVPKDAALHAEAYVAPSFGQDIKPGMQVSLSPDQANQETSGFLLGTVDSVSPLPSSFASIYQHLGDEVLARQVSQNGHTLRVTIQLTPDPASPSGYAWSTSRGSAFRPALGTVTDVSIKLGEQRPIGLLIPGLGR